MSGRDKTALDAGFEALRAHAATLEGTHLRDLFAQDPGRFDRLSLVFGDMLLDVSKTAITPETVTLLADVASAAGLAERRDAMLSGAAINATEGRAVLHTALRAGPDAVVTVDGQDVMPDVRETRTRMLAFAENVRSGTIAAANGARFTDVVNIGIGGSDLGPAMAAAALAPYHDGPRTHFVSNVDGAHLTDTLKDCTPETTLFVIASKTFTTLETMTNARSARRWIAGALGEAAVGDHFAAVSTALDKVADFGIDQARVFGFWDWVGGRYSLWSSIGLPIAIAIGAEDFMAFLDGGRAMDEHFRSEPLEWNMPVLLGLIGVWHRSVKGYPSRAVLPYDQRLSRLPAYLQQLDMESNGKRVTLDGSDVDGATGPIVWGEPGTNGQHAFYQLIHQGTDVIPCEFLVAAQGHETEMAQHHAMLVANCLAQSEALMRGRTTDEAAAALRDAGHSEAEVERLAAHKTFPGSRPSTTLMYRRLDPNTLGRIIALYEHRVFVEGTIWGINSFDQWGVELGKELAAALLPVVEGSSDPDANDASTRGLVAHLRGLKG